ncbi:MAG: metallophosphoesterase [Gemmatimonadales bacterium]
MAHGLPVALNRRRGFRWQAVALAGLWAAACGPQRPAPSLVPVPEDSAIETSVFLIGDAGEPGPDEPVLRALARLASTAPTRRLIVFLGDNLYPSGLPAPEAKDYAEASGRLLAQIAVGIGTGTPTVFIPGNHDWGRMGRDGWNAIRRQSAFIDSVGAPLVRMYPAGGCPGPVVRDPGPRLRLVFLDTQWWVHEFAKPVGGSGCPTDTPDQIADSLAAALANAGDRVVIVAGHHPLESVAEHGGYYGLTAHLFPLRRLAPWLWIPLPIVGSYDKVLRKGGATNQDVSGPLYQELRDGLEQVFRIYRPLVYASGHDHNLQVLKLDGVHYQLVSGAGIFGHEGPAGYRDYTLYASARAGFMRIDLLRDGRTRLGVLEVGEDGEAVEGFAMYLD